MFSSCIIDFVVCVQVSFLKSISGLDKTNTDRYEDHRSLW